jgi:retinal rod rhodopsin-sensitive cGMP 3',5'-cyclic phosphodiesterase subunit delta
MSGPAFTCNSLILRDAHGGRVLATCDCPSDEFDIHVPASTLKCSAVSREVCFSSRDALEKFSIVQLVRLHGQLIEQWSFKFGFVIPGSTNTWQTTVVAAGDGQMLPAEVLSGNTVIETQFCDGDRVIATSTARVFYDL